MSVFQTKTPSSYGKRLLAFIIDYIILCIFGILLGLLFSNFFSSLSWQNRLIGFAIYFSYFSICDSNLLHGQTIGKKLFKLKTVSINNTEINFFHSVIRTLPLAFIFLLNGWNLPFPQNSIVVYFVAFILFSLCITEVVSVIINRGNSRQIFHDMISNCIVIDTSGKDESIEKVNTRKIIIISSIALLILTGCCVTFSILCQSNELKQLSVVSNSISTMNNVNSCSIQKGSTTSNALTTNYVIINVYKSSKNDDSSNIANNIAKIVLNDIIVSNVQYLIIRVHYGYDIGLSSFNTYTAFNKPINEWQKEIK